MPAGTAGVQIRLQSPSGQTQLLGAAPGTIVGGRDFVDSHLPAGSSWTTPEHVRIRVTSQTSAGATVEIRFAAGAPTPPAAPAPVRGSPGHGGPHHVDSSARQRGDHSAVHDHPIR